MTLVSNHPRTLFHYATLSAVFGIATTKRLWATSIGHLADSTEFSYAHDVLRQALERTTRGLPADMAAAVALLVDHLAFAQRQRHFPRLGTASAVYISSLSERGDQLSQWRTYCPSGGYALGFRIESLKQIADEQGFDLVQCSYDKDEHWGNAQVLAAETMNRVDKIPLALRKSIPADVRAVGMGVLEAIFPIRTYMLEEIQRRAPAWKHPSFHEELEWRLVSRHSDRKVKFRVGRNALIPYVEIELDRPSTVLAGLVDALCETYIGPCAEPELAVGSIMQLFETEGIACPQYIISSTPYRQW